MALLFWEGFDSYSNAFQLYNTRANVLNANWDRSIGNKYQSSGSFSSTAGRYGKSGITYQYNNTDCWGMIYVGNTTELYTGRAIYVTATKDTSLVCVWGNNNPFVPTPTSSTVVPEVWFDVSSGTVRAFGKGNASYNTSLYSSRTSGSNNAIGSSNAALSYGTWNWLETRVKLSSSSTTFDGVVEVWINNTLVLSNTACVTRSSNSVTGYHGVNYWCTIGTWETYGTGGGWSVDDIYVLDTTGPAPWNTRLGDSRIVSLPVVSNGPVNTNTTPGTCKLSTIFSNCTISNNSLTCQPQSGSIAKTTHFVNSGNLYFEDSSHVS